MTIQIPLTLWTLICLGLLYLMLDRMLFRPLFAVMDARRKKIADAESARAPEEEDAGVADTAEAEAQSEEKTHEDADAVRAEGKRLLEEARQKRIDNVSAFRADSEKEYADYMQKISGTLDEAADDLANHILEHRS
ncbi:MAG: hypothetical protein MJ175_10975 [Clostridia bacterium]|nr:hypothetical protein [Clostridia bacterium]